MIHIGIIRTINAEEAEVYFEALAQTLACALIQPTAAGADVFLKPKDQVACILEGYNIVLGAVYAAPKAASLKKALGDIAEIIASLKVITPQGTSTALAPDSVLKIQQLRQTLQQLL